MKSWEKAPSPASQRREEIRCYSFFSSDIQKIIIVVARRRCIHIVCIKLVYIHCVNIHCVRYGRGMRVVCDGAPLSQQFDFTENWPFLFTCLGNSPSFQSCFMKWIFKVAFGTKSLETHLPRLFHVLSSLNHTGMCTEHFGMVHRDRALFRTIWYRPESYLPIKYLYLTPVDTRIPTGIPT